MSSSELSRLVLGLIRPFRNDVLVPEIMQGLHRENINKQTVRCVTERFADILKKHVPEETREIITNRLESFIDDAMNEMLGNQQRHNSNGTGGMNQDNADAVLVCFAYYLCEPTDLGLHANDLPPLETTID